MLLIHYCYYTRLGAKTVHSKITFETWGQAVNRNGKKITNPKLTLYLFFNSYQPSSNDDRLEKPQLKNYIFFIAFINFRRLPCVYLLINKKKVQRNYMFFIVSFRFLYFFFKNNPPYAMRISGLSCYCASSNFVWLWIKNWKLQKLCVIEF